MEAKSVNFKNLDDVVFENRNKDYGAYAIRRSYHDNVNKGFSFTLLSIGVLAALYSFASYFVSGKVIPAITIPPTETHPSQVPEIIPNKKLQLVQVKSNANHNYAPRPTADPVPETVDIPETNTTTVANATGTDTGEVLFTDGDGGGDYPNVSAGIGAPAIATPTIFTVVEQMPEYIGGMEAMVRYLQNNLRYPAAARRLGTEGTVFISFIINKDGSVIQAEVLKGLSKECDDEAKRVIARMPTWKPGKQSNMPVMVRMVLPVKYKLNSAF